MEFSMANICRTCMNDENELFSIFTVHEDEKKTFADILMICASVKVTPGDGLPEVICVLCKEQLTASFNFKIQSEQIDATLREVTLNPDCEENRDETEISDDENKDETLDKTDKIIDNEITTELISEDTPQRESEEEDEAKKMEIERIELLLEDVEEDIITEEEYLAMEAVDRKMHTCERCFKIFTRLGSYLTHKKRFCLDSYNCDECNLTFSTQNEYRRHRKTNHHRKDYKCELCSRVFRSSHGLNYHVKIHTGVKEYECPYENCTKKFTLKQAMEKHISVHKNDGKFLCYRCGKMYSTWDALHYHIKTHDGARPHVCDQCGKSFKQACHLKSHMWVHSGIKPHECTTCGKCYTSGHQLKKHQRKNACHTKNNNV